ncbi:MAG: alkaline phosphatase family protein [Candidatus Baldrarchaeia archaeon]
MGKVAVIGLDGLSWDILLPYVNFLPNLRRLLSSSIVGSLNCRPPLTPPSWTSIFTGVVPEKHGILGFAKYYRKSSKLTYRFYNAADVLVPRISEILAFHGLSSLLINHVLSYPFSAWYCKNHVIIYDVLSPREFVYPRSLRRYLKYFKYPGDKLTLRAGGSEILGRWSELVRLRIEGTVKLVEEINPDMLIEVISETDSAMHKVPPIAARKFVSEYLRILEPIDTLVKYAMRNFDIVVLVSDHGLRLFRKSINLWCLLDDVGSESTNEMSLKKFFTSLILTSRISGVVGYSLLSLMQTYTLFYKLRNLLRKSMERKTNQVFKDSEFYFDPIDASDAMILYFENRKKRDRTYRLAKDILEELLDEVKKIDVDSVPSLMLIPKHGYYLNMDAIYRGCNAKIIEFPSARHTTLGIFALWRKWCKRANSVGIVHNADIVPTILTILHLPVPSYMDGKSIVSKKGNINPKTVG